MAKMNWDRAKSLGVTEDMLDGEGRLKQDAAARWLDRAVEAKAKPAKKPTPSTKREHRRAGPPAARTGIVIYTDGACVPNPGRGGWGFAVYLDGREIHSASGGAVQSTNNIMEMTGVLRALEWLSARSDIQGATVLSDSQYVVKGCNEWRHGWKAKGWRRVVDRARGTLEPVKNAELWQELDKALRAVSIKLEWVKGHVGILGNERADELSNIGRREATAGRQRVDMIAEQLREAS